MDAADAADAAVQNHRFHSSEEKFVRRIGPARHSSFISRSYPALVSTIVGSDVQGLDNLPTVFSSSINIPALPYNEQRVMSVGNIPAPDLDVKELEKYIKDLAIQTELPEIKDPAGDDKPVKLPWKEQKKALAAKMRRFHNTSSANLYTGGYVDRSKTFKQKEDTEVDVTFRKDPQLKSEIDLKYTFLYKDNAKPTIQPREVAHVKLTYANTRNSGDLIPEDKVDVYCDTHRVVDVSSKTFDSYLKSLFPHAVLQDKNYFIKLRASVEGLENGLFLIMFPHNERPYGTNLFTPREVPNSHYRSLATIMKNTPRIFMLVRGCDMSETVSEITHEFSILATYNPLTEFFLNPEQRCINSKGIKPNSDLPKFVAPAQHAFESYEEFEYHIGLGAIIEQRVTAGSFDYSGKAACLPIAGTYSALAGLDMAYTLVITLDKESQHLPRLNPGNFVHVSFSTDANISGPYWKGRVTPACVATGLGQLTVNVNRPTKMGDIQEHEKYSQLAATDFDKMSPKQAKSWARDNCNIDIQLHVKGGSEELNRITHNLERLHLPKELRTKQPLRYRMLDMYQQLLTCNDYTILPRESLWAGVRVEQLEAAKAVIYTSLRDYQAEVVRGWEDNNVVARTIALGGPSGSGKTTTLRYVLLPYLLEIEVSNEELKAMDAELREFIDAEAAKEKAYELAIAPEDDTKAICHKSSYKWGEPIRSQRINQVVNQDIISEGSDATEVDPPIYQNGRLTLCAVQNDTVDALYSSFKQLAECFAAKMEHEPFLGIRLHSPDTEIDAAVAMLRPDFDYKADNHPCNMGNTDRYRGPVSQNLISNHVQIMQGSQFRGIRDSRFKDIDGSMATYMLQAANVPGFGRSAELMAAFTSGELAALTEDTTHVRNAFQELCSNGNKLDGDLSNMIKRGLQTAYRKLLRKASFIVCTIATATNNGFNAIRQSTVILQEEASRSPEADTVGSFSHFALARLHLMDGCWKQLGPNVQDHELDNNFRFQGKLSLLHRLHTTGFPIQELNKTARFKNELQLKICRIVNDKPDLQAVEGSFDAKATQAACHTMFALWKVSCPVVFINIPKSTVRKTATGSAYNVEFAIVAMHSITHRLQKDSGSQITYMSPYNAQVSLVKGFLMEAQAKALAANNPGLASRMGDAQLSTVDSYMGNENDHVIMDFAGHIGFVYDLPRHLVANTRARVSTEYLCATYEVCLSNRIKRNHPFREILEAIHNLKAIVSIPPAIHRTFTQYKSTIDALDTNTGNGTLVTR